MGVIRETRREKGKDKGKEKPQHSEEHCGSKYSYRFQRINRTP